MKFHYSATFLSSDLIASSATPGVGDNMKSCYLKKINDWADNNDWNDQSSILNREPEYTLYYTNHLITHHISHHGIFWTWDIVRLMPCGNFVCCVVTYYSIIVLAWAICLIPFCKILCIWKTKIFSTFYTNMFDGVITWSCHEQVTSYVWHHVCGLWSQHGIIF